MTAIVHTGSERASAEQFAAALRVHLPVVLRVAQRFAPAGDAEDVAQEACLAAWRYRHRFDPDRGTFRAWLLAITFRESCKAGGRQNRRGELFLRLRVTARVDPASGSGDQVLEEAIAHLSRRQRDVVELHYFVDLPVAEVAEVLGISAGTVKSTLFDARTRIRDYLQERGR